MELGCCVSELAAVCLVVCTAIYVFSHVSDLPAAQSAVCHDSRDSHGRNEVHLSHARSAKDESIALSRPSSVQSTITRYKM